MKTTFFILTLAVLIGSCTNVNRSKRLAKLDQITHSADSLEKIISVNRSDSSFQMSENIKGVEIQFKQFYFADSVDRQLANDINDLKQARKVLVHLNNDCINLLKGSKELKESARLLRYDIENADGDRKKYDEYISHEKSKMDMLTRMGEDYMKEREQSFEAYSRLFPDMKAYGMGLFEAYEKKKKSGK